MKIIILAGGTGTGLWPVSRIYNPKQFTKFKGAGESIFQLTIKKCSEFVNMEDIIIVTNSAYKYFVCGQLDEIGVKIPDSNILLEPSFKNTLHAVSLGAFTLKGRGLGDVGALVLPANSAVSNYEDIFDDGEGFQNTDAFGNYILTFGVEAAGAYTGCGYIKAGGSCESGYIVDKFIEKPDGCDVQKLIEEGYMYNSGILRFKPDTFIKELEDLQPGLYELFMGGDIDDIYMSDTEGTVEKAILEKSGRVAVIPIGKKWDMSNEFASYYRRYGEGGDRDGNISFNDNVFIESKNNLVYAEGSKVVSLIGVDGLVVIDQPDALLVCDSAKTDRVRDIALVLKGRGDPRVEYHATCYRPWGSYTVLEEGAGYKIKRIMVLPGKKLSYQMHYQRSEHWVVVKGTANVIKNDHEYVVHSGESIFLSIGEKHRLENPGKTLLEVIEVQIGSYLEEDDIVRFEDDYGRG